MELQNAPVTARAELESPASCNVLPAQVIERLKQLTLELVASGRAGKAKHAGEASPSFRLPAADGTTVGSPDLVDAPLVIVFVAGNWCPCCTLELRALERFRPAAEHLGARIIAISADSVDDNRHASSEMHLKFPLLSDHGGRVSSAFGLRHHLPADVAEIYRDHFGAAFRLKSGRDEVWLPMHARYVVDRGGQIVFSEVDPDYTRRFEPTELIPVLEHLCQRKSGL